MVIFLTPPQTTWDIHTTNTFLYCWLWSYTAVRCRRPLSWRLFLYPEIFIW